MAYQLLRVAGSSVSIERPSWCEMHRFATAREAEGRAAVVREALSWIGTPFVDCADVKGPGGGVDCAMLLVRAYVDAGRLVPFDPRPYPPQWHLHNNRERFLEWMRERLGGREVEEPRLGDVAVYRFGRCYSHGAIVISGREVLHAFYKNGVVCPARRDETDLARLPGGRPRPVKFFDVWEAAP